MKVQLPQFIFLALAFCVKAQHFEAPQETNVDSPAWSQESDTDSTVCKTNKDGFGGQTISNEAYSESTFFYELLVAGQNLPDDAVSAMIFEVEQRIADFLLSETTYFGMCGTDAVRRRTRSSLRRLQNEGAIAITINPPDDVLEGGKLVISH